MCKQIKTFIPAGPLVVKVVLLSNNEDTVQTCIGIDIITYNICN